MGPIAKAMKACATKYNKVEKSMHPRYCKCGNSPAGFHDGRRLSDIERTVIMVSLGTFKANI